MLPREPAGMDVWAQPVVQISQQVVSRCVYHDVTEGAVQY
jgi:hypothetical protein